MADGPQAKRSKPGPPVAAVMALATFARALKAAVMKLNVEYVLFPVLFPILFPVLFMLSSIS